MASDDPNASPWWALRYEALAEVDPAFAGAVDTTTELEAEFVRDVLELQDGAKVLDVGCGGGRHAIALQERGFDVTGVDLSPRILRIAREQWETRHPGENGPTWTPGDMRRLSGRGPYDAAILMDHTFGVFDDDAEHLRVLTSVADQLAPGGHVLLQAFNPYWWASRPATRHFPPGTLVPDADVIRSYRLDFVRGRLEDRLVVFRGGERFEPPVQSLRAWTPIELVSLCRAAGFRKVAVHGSDGWAPPEDVAPVNADSVWLWVVATLP